MDIGGGFPVRYQDEEIDLEDAGEGRWARHLEVVQAIPDKLLRLRGALGPLQAMAVSAGLDV